MQQYGHKRSTPNVHPHTSTPGLLAGLPVLSLPGFWPAQEAWEERDRASLYSLTSGHEVGGQMRSALLCPLGRLPFSSFKAAPSVRL